jgi:hypothetical protein
MQLPLSALQSHIIVGSHDITNSHVVALLQEHLCDHSGRDHCTTCRAIENHQHHMMMWLFPREYYTLDQFDPVLARIMIALDKEEKFFTFR